MDCQSARILIEAFHDDELGVAEAAELLAHLEACPPCTERDHEVDQLRALLRETRPPDSCPEALRKRLSGAIPNEPPRFRRPWRMALAAGVIAAGTGFVVGGKLASSRIAAGMSMSSASIILEPPVTKEVEGDVFCLRCAVQHEFPNGALAHAGHHPVLRTADGKLYAIVDDDSARRCLASGGCAPRHVTVTAHLWDRTALAEILK